MPSSADCPSEESLIAFSEGRLPADEQEAVTGHLEACAACQSALGWVREHLLRRLDSNGEQAETQYELTDQRDIATGPINREQESAYDVLEPSLTKEAIGKLNNYEVRKVLGRGGYGIVFEAYDGMLNRSVAIKVLKRDLASRATSRRRFIREARAGAAINHPNVVTIHHVEEAGDVPFLIMELIQGESLRERIRREPKLDAMDVLRISAQIAQGLAAAHAQGIIHRDVKPGNIMLVDATRVKITDFGLARVTVEEVEFTSRGLAVGTPAYMAPEQVRGEEVDARSDLFALGCVMYAMFTGHSPFYGQTALEIARRIDTFEPPHLIEVNKGVPVFLDTIVHRLLQKDRTRRFQSAAEVADALNRHLAILNQTPSDRMPAALQMQLAEPPRRRKWPWPAMALVALVLACIGGAALGFKYFYPPGTTPVVPGPEGDSPTIPVAQRKQQVTVAKSGPADCTTIGEALRRVATGGTVTVLDSGEYPESLRLSGSERFAGVRLVAPQHAKLLSSDKTAVVVAGVPKLRLEGLVVVAPQGQHAIEITGVCPGLQLEGIRIERDAGGVENSVAALVLRRGAAGTAEAPIVVRKMTLASTNVGIVIGNQTTTDDPPRHIVIEECLVEGLSAEKSTSLALLRRSEDIVIRRNIFAQGMQGISILTESAPPPAELSMPVRLQILNNTWHNFRSWLVWSGPATEPVTIQMHHNLIVDARWIAPAARTLTAAAGEPPVFANNLRVTTSGAAADSFAPAASEATSFPLLSVDSADPNYLKPDFARLKAAGAALDPVPGRYSEGDLP